MFVSILIPVYNERTVVERSLAMVLAAPLPDGLGRELVIVDDCSTDGTSAILERIASEHPEIRLFRQSVNQGKGAAVRRAIQEANGDFCLIQDADLEYDAAEYPKLLKPLLDGHADAVFGSRYLAGDQMRVLPYWHSMINKFLTLVSNMFSNLNVTDMETCYKVFRTDLLKSIPIRSDRFGFEPEITMKCSKRQFRVYEVPISYHGRTYEEGKKIGWKDGAKALGVVLYFWLVDDLYTPDYGRSLLNSLTGTPQYVNWVTSLLRPHLGATIFELGAGMGNFTGRLMGKKLRWVAAESDALYLHALRNRFLKTPSVQVESLDPNERTAFVPWQATFESALCVNLLETVDDPAQVVRSLASSLAPGGNMIVLVPHGPSLAGPLDEGLGHKRRFSARQLRTILEQAGLEVVDERDFNKIGSFFWWVSGKLLGQRTMNRVLLKLWDKTVWFWRRVDFLLPWSGLSLIAVARTKKG
jgi:glycosyltransferase involved in cell wall biosynthesis